MLRAAKPCIESEKLFAYDDMLKKFCNRALGRQLKNRFQTRLLEILPSRRSRVRSTMNTSFSVFAYSYIECLWSSIFRDRCERFHLAGESSLLSPIMLCSRTLRNMLVKYSFRFNAKPFQFSKYKTHLSKCIRLWRRRGCDLFKSVGNIYIYIYIE